MKFFKVCCVSMFFPPLSRERFLHPVDSPCQKLTPWKNSCVGTLPVGAHLHQTGKQTIFGIKRAWCHLILVPQSLVPPAFRMHTYGPPENQPKIGFGVGGLSWQGGPMETKLYMGGHQHTGPRGTGTYSELVALQRNLRCRQGYVRDRGRRKFGCSDNRRSGAMVAAVGGRQPRETRHPHCERFQISCLLQAPALSPCPSGRHGFLFPPPKPCAFLKRATERTHGESKTLGPGVRRNLRTG